MICSRCIYDDHIPYITFDAEGVCSYCRQTEQLNRDYPTGEAGKAVLRGLADQIRRDGKGRKYDVVVGVSGGTDSSHLVELALELGLRPLAAHFDNTWNGKTAVENIHRVLGSLKVDLYTHVVDNQEYCDLFRAFLLAAVPDIDTPSDIGLATTHYLACAKHGIRWIFEGHSFRTEGISPHGWFYMDAKYIETVARTFGSGKIETFPNLWMSRWLKWCVIDRVRKVRPLYWLDYDKEAIKARLKERYGWTWYGGHHMENRTAYFTNNYWLPRKFNIDLRWCEYSALVRSGQLTRDEALVRIREPKPFDEGLLAEVKKRLGFSDEAWAAVMAAPNKSYRDYRTYKKTFERLRPFFWLLVKLGRVPQSFYLKYTRRYEG